MFLIEHKYQKNWQQILGRVGPVSEASRVKRTKFVASFSGE